MKPFGYESPPRTKWDRGRVIIMGGSSGTSFTVHIACMGAMRAGAGLTVAVVPTPLLPSLDTQKSYKILGFDDYNASLPSPVSSLLQSSHVLVAGMGIEENFRTIRRFFAQVLRKAPPWVVIDADLILALSQEPALLTYRSQKQQCLLTLNYRETEMLFGTKRPLEQSLLAFCREFNVALLLKHEAAILITNSGVALRTPNNTTPEIAVAGSGDLLAGLIGGLLAQNADIREAVETALSLRRNAASLYTQTTGDLVAHPNDIIPWIPYAWQTIKETREKGKR